MTDFTPSNQVIAPQARCRAGAARRDITPPVGIYHRMWGAATHDRATGVHRPLLATVLILEPPAGDNAARQVIAAIDHCLMWADDMNRLQERICKASSIRPEQLQIAFSHTHAAGLMDSSRASLPGGELIAPYLEKLADSVADAIREALSRLQPASIVYALGPCNLAAHRDYWDETTGQVVCGFNPSGNADDTLLVGRIDDEAGRPIATVVNYACHPTTLAWDNTLISPDYVGAMRKLIERDHGGLTVFLQGASGDLGPREGYVGDVTVADRNGRQLGHSALSVLEGMPKANARFSFAGPVVSGATIGTWRYEELSPEHFARHAIWDIRHWAIEIPYRTDLSNAEQTRLELVHWQEEEKQALAAGDAIAKRDCHAQVERMNRQLTRLAQLPAGRTFPLPVTCWRIGDGIWIMLEGEYYQDLQRTLRERFPDTPIVVATVVNGWRPAYLPTRETYGRGIYQEQVAILEPGCLEQAIDSIAATIAEMID